MTYDVFYGLMLNKQLAIALNAISVNWGIQVALNGVPSLLMFDAESECAGEDAGYRMNQAMTDFQMREAMQKFHENFGGHG